MLEEGARLADAGSDVVVALVESHGRAGVEALLAGFEQVPLRRLSYHDAQFDELDVDGVLRRDPQVALVDELAHTNVPGCRHEKRWQDVEELLSAGIDVVTTINVSHIDSLNEAVESLTGVAAPETVPDQVVAAADRVELIDLSPGMLQARISEGAVLAAGDASAGLAGYYEAENLAALRHVALSWLDDHDLGAAADGARATVRVVAALTGASEGRHVVRRAAQIAISAGAELVGVHVREPSGLAESQPAWLDEQRRLLAEVGGRYTDVAGVDVARALLDVCRSEQAEHLVLGTSRRSRRDEILHGSVIERVIRAAGPIEVHVIPARPTRKAPKRAHSGPLTGRGRVPLPGRRRQLAWVLAVVALLVLPLALLPFRSSVGVAGALFAALLGVVVVAAIGGVGPAAVAIIVGILTADFLFTVPYNSLHVDRLIDVIALVAFAVVGGVIGVLVDILARQGVRVAGARTEAEGLSRLAAQSLSTTPDTLPQVADALRDTFGLDSVAVLHRTGGAWNTEFVAGTPAPRQPEDSPLTAELTDGRVLVLMTNPASDRDVELLRSFVNELRHHREQDQLARLQREPPPPTSHGPDPAN
jgi:two-component system sensor histidine kinase KdpD